MKKLVFLFAVAICAASAAAQTVTLSGSYTEDGNAPAYGTLYAAPVLANGIAAVYHRGGGGMATVAPVTALVQNGAFSMTLPDTALTIPANLCFKITLVTTNGSSVLNSCLQPTANNYYCTSGACNFDNVLPSATPLSVYNNTTINGAAGPWILGSGFTCNTATFTCTANGGSGGPMTWPSAPGLAACSGTPCTAWVTPTAAMVESALGFTPYNATNPSGYITSSALAPYLLSSGFTAAAIESLLGGGEYDPYGAAATAQSNAEAYSANASHLSSGTVAGGLLPSTAVQTNQVNTYGAYLQDFSGASVKLPSGFLSGDCTWTALGVITCTKSNGTAFGTGAFAAAYSLPGTVVQTGQANTYGAYLQDFSGASQLKHPVAAGYASAANGELGYDSTNLNWHGWVNGVDMFAAFLPKTGITNSHCVEFAVSGNTITLQDAGGTCTTGGSMVWPTTAGIPYWASGTAWGGAYNASTPIPASYLPTTLVYNGQANAYGAFLQDFSSASVKLPAGFLSGDCTWTALGVITCTKSNGTAFGTGAFAAAYSLPGTVVQTGQANTYGNYLQDFSGGTVKLPAGFLSGDCTWTALGVITCTKSNGTAFGTAAFQASSAFVPTTTTVNGHALSSNVVVSASDLSTGTLPHAQLPTLLSGDIPNNAANTSGSAASLGAASALPNLTTATTQSACDNSTNLATTAYTNTHCIKVLTTGTSYTPGMVTGTFWNNTSGAFALNLSTPTTATLGADQCFGNFGTRTGVLSIIPPSGVTIYYEATTGTAGSSTGLVSGGAMSDYICVEATSTTTYQAIGAGYGTWLNH